VFPAQIFGETLVAESVGSLIDKICIAELKVFHIAEQSERTDVGEEHRALCRERLAVMGDQRNDLVKELDGLLARYSKGEWQPKVYRQFKMYNDPRFRAPRRTHAS
jgi:hypothetical protein